MSRDLNHQDNQGPADADADADIGENNDVDKEWQKRWSQNFIPISIDDHDNLDDDSDDQDGEDGDHQGGGGRAKS